GARAAAHDLRAPDLHPREPGRAGAPAVAAGRAQHVLLRRVPRLGLPRGRLRVGPAGRGGAGVRLVRSALYEGQVVHDRRTGLRNLFRYRGYMWHVDLDELDALDRRLWAFGHDHRALTTIRSRDHLGDPRRPIRENVDRYLSAHGIDLEGGRVSLLTNARVLG